MCRAQNRSQRAPSGRAGHTACILQLQPLDYVAGLVTDSTMTHIDSSYETQIPAEENGVSKEEQSRPLRETPGSSEAPIKWN